MRFLRSPGPTRGQAQSKKNIKIFMKIKKWILLCALASFLIGGAVQAVEPTWPALNSVLLITDSTIDAAAIVDLQNTAADKGISSGILNVSDQGVDYFLESSLTQKLIGAQAELQRAHSLIIWTKHNIGVNALIGAAQEFNRSGITANLGFKDKSIVILTDANLNNTGRLAQNIYNLLAPKSLLLTEPRAANEVARELDGDKIINVLKTQKIDYQVLGLHTERTLNGLRPWNFLSYLINFMVNNGVSLNTIYLILILPVIATLIAFARQVIGVKAFGIYAPSLVAVSFLATGLKYGIAIFASVLIIGTLGRLLARKIKLMYLPRMAIVLTLVSLSILAWLAVGAYFNKVGLIAISIYPILIMVIITEKFVAVQIEKGSAIALQLIAETLVLSVACYFLAYWESFRMLILGYPEVILLTFIINLILGRWAGLRLIELYRFRKVIDNVELAEKKS
jgi:hypothetical protein